MGKCVAIGITVIEDAIALIQICKPSADAERAGLSSQGNARIQQL